MTESDQADTQAVEKTAKPVRRRKTVKKNPVMTSFAVLSLGFAVMSLVCIGIIAATAYGVFGISSFFFLGLFIAIPALVLGIIGYSLINREPKQFKGKNIAGWGIAVSIIAVVLCLMLDAAVLFPAMDQARIEKTDKECRVKLSAVAAGIKMYMADHDGKLPQNFEVLKKAGYIGQKSLTCPFAENQKKSSYVYRGQDLPPTANETMILVHDNPEIHREHRCENINIITADGSVKSVSFPELEKMIKLDNIQRKSMNLARK